ncbi:MAG: oligoendopeptidase F [Gemmatales bacterium]|nr:MAG: oligoendopeptidase F [Gemmatales bacterium]
MLMMRLGVVVLVLLACLHIVVRGDEATTAEARKVVADFEAKFKPLETAANLAWWQANITGREEDFKKKVEAQNKIDDMLADPKAFAKIKALKQSKKIDDPIIARAIDVIYLKYLEKQVPADLLRKIVEKMNEVEKKFNVFRANVDGKELTDNQVRNVLRGSRSSKDRQRVWEASKKVGEIVEADLKELVRLRNQAAQKLGFKNFHDLQLFLNEQDSDELMKLFDELDELTREPFIAAKKDIDKRLALQCRVRVDDLMPWHYHDPFFQQTPAVFEGNIDAPYQKIDLVKITQDFYNGINLPVDSVVARSDLFEKRGKSPHAFCIDIDRDGDVRVLCNVVGNEQWMSTLLHEFGHAVYSSKYIPDSLPYVLRAESHILTTEGIAMMFERLAKKRAWIEKMGGVVVNPKAFDEAADKMQRYQLLIFSRWCQVMLRFEKAMYENPEQDLSDLWWGLVEKYQMLKRPEGRKAPDYASKIHIVVAPVYYHNYMMGELFASQLHHAIAKEVYKGADPKTVIYVKNEQVGRFLRAKVFNPGKTMTWNVLTKFATGEPLSAKAFAADFKGE